MTVTPQNLTSSPTCCPITTELHSHVQGLHEKLFYDRLVLKSTTPYNKSVRKTEHKRYKTKHIWYHRGR
jgi:hypothetical protein